MGAQLEHARRLVAAVTNAQVLERLEQEAERASVAASSVPRTRSVGARWWCRQCFAFAAGEYSACPKCRDAGPHHLGEESNAPGFKARRDRLKRERRRRHGGRR